MPAAGAPLTLSEAISIALQRNAGIKVQAEDLNQALAREQQARGQFDTRVSAGAGQQRTVTPYAGVLAPGAPGETRGIATGYGVGASKVLGNGMSVSGTLDAASLESADLDGIRHPPQNTVTLGLAVSIPLLKGRGADVAGLTLRLASLNGEANRYALRDRIAQVLFDTLSAYWAYLAQDRIEKVALETERRSRQLLESTRKLVQANERPRADLVLLEAVYADKSAARLLASQQLVEARRQLARLLGLDRDAGDALGLPADPFPTESAEVQRLLPLADVIGALAMQRRPDVRIIRNQRDQAQLEFAVAGKNLKPQLDLIVGTAYTKASEGGSRFGFVARPGRAQTEPSVYARLAFEFPVKNNQAIGAYRERASVLLQSEIRLRDTEAAIRTAVDNAMLQLSTSEQHLRLAKQSLTRYDEAVRNEVVKQRNGIATLLDVMTLQDRLDSAQESVIRLQAEYAQAVARVQHETATLLPWDPGVVPQPDAVRFHIADLTGLDPLLRRLPRPPVPSKESP